jgi:hypothetical protein
MVGADDVATSHYATPECQRRIIVIFSRAQASSTVTADIVKRLKCTFACKTLSSALDMNENLQQAMKALF